MTEINIKYNPYKVETAITVDGSPVKRKSKLIVGDKRLQEWVEELPKIIKEEYNINEFNLNFHGTLPDYEDIELVTERAREDGVIIHLKHIPAKETKDKLPTINTLFQQIKEGPFEELKQTDLIRAFELVMSSEFEINVVATMSAGKSTLINSLLQQKLMPAKQEACTAIITKLKDVKKPCFSATVFDRDGNLIEQSSELTLEQMDTFNSNINVSTINAKGSIPFMKGGDVSLVLVDTPGPNNSRDPKHKEATFRNLSESSKALVLYILNATQLAANDDSLLLDAVAASMKVGGKQSRDRFIFIVNKIDDFKKGEDSIPGALERVKKYLEDKGIVDPNIYPASALTALHIRTLLMNEPTLKQLDDDEEDGSVDSAKKSGRIFNRSEEKHLEKYINYSHLAQSAQKKVDNMLVELDFDVYSKDAALIHTGIISIELAIKQYVEKYAKTAKIKNLADTFYQKLESANSFEKTKQEIMQHQEKQIEIQIKLEEIEERIKDGENAKKFKDKVDAINYSPEIASSSKKLLDQLQSDISARLFSGEMSKEEASIKGLSLAKFCEGLQIRFKVGLENIIKNHIRKNAEELLNQYKARIASLTSDLSIDNAFSMNPFEFVQKDAAALHLDSLLEDSTKISRKYVGKEKDEWIENKDKHWYNPFTWFDEKGHWTYKEIYENCQYIDGSKFAQDIVAPIEIRLRENQKGAKIYAEERTKELKTAFKKEFDRLDAILVSKLNELKTCMQDKENVDRMIAESEDRLKWLKEIQNQVNNILEI